MHCARTLAVRALERIGPLNSDNSYDFYLLEFGLYSPHLVVSTVGSTQLALQMGTAFRLGVKVLRTTSTAKLNMSGVAASASLKLATTSLQATFQGMRHELSSKLGNYFTLGQPFDSTALENIGKMLGDFEDSVVAHPEWLEPTKLAAATLRSGAGEDYLQAITAAYALRRLEKGDSYSTALSHLTSRIEHGGEKYFYDEVSSWLMRSVYWQIGQDPDARVTSSSQKTAEMIYDHQPMRSPP